MMETQEQNLAHAAPSETVPISWPQTLIGATGADQSGQELPLVVWLRGDENHAGDFTVDAEEAMRLLGIKRSRLTQISGRELRVGRMRVDRYVRPLYRRADIDEYNEWTRATASHVKSSNLIKEAANTLEKQTQAIVEKIDERLAEFMTAVVGDATHQRIQKTEELLLAQCADLTAHHSQTLNEVQKTADHLTQTTTAALRSHIERLEGDNAQLQNRLTEMTQHVQTQSRILEILHGSTAELAHLSRQSWQALQNLQQNQNAFAKDMGRALALIIEHQRQLVPGEGSRSQSTRKLSFAPRRVRRNRCR